MLFHNKPTLTKNADPGALLAAWPQSLKRISSYWMPELRRLGVHAPVILVGTKNDLGKQQEQELSTVRSSLLASQISAHAGLLLPSACINIVIIASRLHEPSTCCWESIGQHLMCCISLDRWHSR